ncbi:MAG: hypothetical protein ACQEP7_05275 [bacterium]
MIFPREIKLSFVLVFVFSVIMPAAAPAVEVEDVVSRLEVKFRRTKSIYLEAVSRKMGEEPDTTHVTVAYRYPGQILQWVRGDDSSEQVFILKEDSACISYPHLDIERREQLTDREKQQILIENFPLAALVGGLQSDSIPEDKINVKQLNSQIKLETKFGGERSQYRRGEAIFDWPQLYPVSFTVQMAGSGSKYRVEILQYKEDKRFPPAIEKTLDRLEPDYLDGDLK